MPTPPSNFTVAMNNGDKVLSWPPIPLVFAYRIDIDGTNYHSATNSLVVNDMEGTQITKGQSRDNPDEWGPWGTAENIDYTLT